MTPRRVLTLLATAELLAMGPWFSASAVAPALAHAWQLSPSGTAWLTVSVQLGFVAGALTSAVLTLADRWSARHLIAAAAALAGLATAGVTLASGPGTALALRFLTGAALAGVYPPGMKLVAGWYRERRGLAIGILVGALTLGSAAPHLVRWLVPADAWRTVLLVAAAAAIVGGQLVLLIPGEGPYAAASPPFRWSAAPTVLADRAVALANGGYLGHMWELYAVWTWLPAFVAASERARGVDGEHVGAVAGLVTFVAVGVGALGCWAGGALADRYGRTLVTSGAMAFSGACALAAGLVFGGPLPVLVALLVVWGIAVVADSAQFSAAVSELAPRDLVGTALTLQTSLGFLLTAVTIYLVPSVAARVGWRWSMSVLAVGPALGVWAMTALRRLPEAVRLASGHR